MNYFPCEKVQKQKVITIGTRQGIILHDTPWLAPNSAILLKDEIHIIGCRTGGDNAVKHYKWNSSNDSWEQVSTLPQSIIDINGIAIVLDNEIHCLIGTSHYKWDGETWTNVGTLPLQFNSGLAVVLDGEIHYFVSSAHYKWDGETWTNVGTSPQVSNNSAVVVVDGEMYFLGGPNSANQYIYKWDGEAWTKVGTLPTNNQMKYRQAIAMGGYIYIFCYPNDNTDINRWNGSDWELHRNIGDSNIYPSPCAVVFHGIHFFGGDSSSSVTKAHHWGLVEVSYPIR